VTWSGGGGFPPRTRKAILARDGHQCTHVDHTGTRCPRTSPLEADHIVGQTEARRLGWTDAEVHHASNGRTLCGEHHAEITRRQARAGMARKSRRRPQRGKHPGLR
jgi:5-methylcytosine-specific restriction endonuclease McrA